MERLLRAAIVAASGLLLWELASLGMHGAEPWDAPGFWYAYLASIGLAAVWGYVFPRSAWLWGAIVMFAQAPVMWLHNGVGSLWVLGLALLGVLALPAVGAAKVGSRFARRRSA